MTRINVVPPKDLHDRHLVAEYHELPRVYGLVRKSIAKGMTPKDFEKYENYTLGTGHVKFFYTRLKWLAERQASLVEEMLSRKMRPQHIRFEELFRGIPRAWFNDWTADEEAINTNRLRLQERLKEMAERPKRKVLSVYDIEKIENKLNAENFMKK